jgi:hypothetical protein
MTNLAVAGDTLIGDDANDRIPSDDCASDEHCGGV